MHIIELTEFFILILATIVHLFALPPWFVVFVVAFFFF